MRMPLRTACLALLCPLLAAAASPPFKPSLGPDMPSLTVTCGELTLLLRQASQWTPGRIDFRGHAMTTERSAYGTVFFFPDCGFIGSAHLENEPEPLESLTFILDGQPLATPAAELKGSSFRFERNSRIRGVSLRCVTELKSGRLHETTTVQAAQETPLKMLYHFMHAWRPTVSACCAGRDAAPDSLLSGTLDDGAETARRFVINQKVDWMAVYEPESRQFAVSRLLSAPEQGGHISMIWNVPGSYRKFYLKCFEKASLPAGFQGTWRMVTGFGSSGPENWRQAARTLANQLRDP